LSTAVGILVFARYDSTRLPGKALRPVGGIPLLERVIRRAQLTPWPVYLATTTKSSDDSLVALAERLGVASFRGSEERVLERGVLAAEEFGLDAFVRLCGDRPLFPLDTLQCAAAAMQSAVPDVEPVPDLVTNFYTGGSVRGLTTEVVRTATLRRIMDRGVSAEEQEHLTLYFYEHPEECEILAIDGPDGEYECPGFAVDTESDVDNLNRIFAMSDAIDLSVQEADRMYSP
jgi:spore coat polysaccharide biosynthesis protein SpsF